MFFHCDNSADQGVSSDLDCLQMSDNNAIGLTGLKTCTNPLQKMMQLTMQFPHDTAAYGGDEGDSLHATW